LACVGGAPGCIHGGGVASAIVSLSSGARCGWRWYSSSPLRRDVYGAGSFGARAARRLHVALLES